MVGRYARISAIAMKAVFAAAQQAVADRREPAPIRYAGANPQAEASASTAPQSPEVAAGMGAGQGDHASAAEPSPQSRANARISFRYPGQERANAAPQPSTQTFAAAPPPSATAEPIQLTPAIVEADSPPVVAVTPSESPVSRQPVAGPTFDEGGMAAWYGDPFHGRETASGEIYDMTEMTAAHPSLPLPSLVQVVNLENSKEVVVRVNDRGPFVDGRIIDLSKRAAEALDFVEAGKARVRIRFLGPAPVEMAEPTSGPLVREIASDTSASANGPIALSEIAPAPAPQVEAQEPYFVQIGAFSNIANAQRLRDSLSADLPARVEATQVGGSDFFRVQVGPFAQETRAVAVRDQLAGRGYGRGMVLRTS